jgi:hypothetical protein
MDFPPLTDCRQIVKTTDNPIFVIPGLTLNPVYFRTLQLMDAGLGLSPT